jgi:two-component system alkaline phosphatase synthesis response regulator PhoP
MIYIVEDDASIRELELYALKSSGFTVEGFDNAQPFYAALKKQLPELIILDIMLPGEDGLSVLKQLRMNQNTQTLPIIMITARGSELDKVKGLDMGADDYMTKPFGIMELISRVKALLRRSSRPEQASVMQCGSIEMDDSRHLVTVSGTPVTLTYKEYELLKYLMVNQGIVLSRDKLMERVWGYDFEGESRTVDMHIKTLRQKLGEAGKLIVTIRNVGYKIGE